MARGGFRPGAGRPKGAKTVKAAKPEAVAAEAAAEGLTPLDYMLSVMRNVSEDPTRRDRMAIAAAPFVHARREPVGQGKKEAAEAAAKKASTGKFASAEPPKLVVNNR